MYSELAEKYLHKARSASGNTRGYFANLCQVCLAKAGAKPEDIGTNRKELVQLQDERSKKKKARRRKNTKSPNDVCKKYLDQCRRAQGASRQYYANLCLSFLTKYAIAPSDIGTTEDELHGLQSRGFLESAGTYLAEARNSSGIKQKCYLDLCWEYLNKANGRPQDIGSSEEELSRMEKNC